MILPILFNKKTNETIEFQAPFEYRQHSTIHIDLYGNVWETEPILQYGAWQYNETNISDNFVFLNKETFFPTK